ncbi:MAG: hypothetical protein ACOC4B_01115 [Bacteroidota bacterium]
MSKWLSTNIYNGLSSYESSLNEDDFQEWVEYCNGNQTCINNRQSAPTDTLVNDELSITEFESISKDITITMEGQDFDVPNFNALQTQANNGVLIVGVRRNTETNNDGTYKSGHIVLISPYQEEDDEDENNDNDNDNDETRSSYGSLSGIEILFPRTVECGGDVKKLGWLSDKFAKDMEWYRYK